MATAGLVGLLASPCLAGEGSSVNWDISWKSRYITPDGTVGSKGPVIQAEATLGRGKNRFTIWTNRGGQGSVQETDFLYTRHIPLGEGALDLGAGLWTFQPPKPVSLNAVDYTLFAKISQELRGVQLRARYDFIVSHKKNEGGHRVCVAVERPFKVGGFVFKPALATAWTSKFYGTDGWRHLTPSLGISRGHWSVKASYQIGLGARSIVYVGLGYRP